MLEGKPLRRKVISRKVEYPPCTLSYTGAVAGSLRALGVDCDPVDVGGYSGYAFLINVAKGTTSASGPTALTVETWKRMLRGTENLGWTIEWRILYPHSYPVKRNNPTTKEIEKVFEEIKREIDEKDRPIVLWGLAASEYGIVKGYEGNSYLTSTFRGFHNQSEDPVPFYDLKAPGCINALFFREKVTKNVVAIGKETLERDINFATAKVSIRAKYVGGPQALNEWANVLENLPEKNRGYMGNSYVGACVCEGRYMCAAFLRRLSDKHPGEQTKDLREAAEHYEEGWKLMKEFVKIFPFKFRGEMRTEDRKKGAEILRRVKPFEKKSIEHMQKALKKWETT